jgi:hypothetical protein
MCSLARWADLRAKFGISLKILLSTEVELHDIKKVLSNEKDVYENNVPPLLCIEKWDHLKQRAMSTARYRVPTTYEGEGVGVEHFVMIRLSYIKSEEDFSRNLEQTSLDLQSQEAKISKSSHEKVAVGKALS